MSASATHYTVACVQTNPGFGEVEANLDVVETLIEGVEADLIVLPELFASGYSFRDADEALELAEPFPTGPTLRRMVRWSEATKGVIVGGYPERDELKAYNAAAVVANGEPLTSYRKIHLFGFEQEVFEPGDRPFPVVEHHGLNVGVMICFDWIFPEASRALALQGADVIAHPSNLVLPGLCQRAMCVRSIENRVYTATANRYGDEHREPRKALAFTGASQIIDVTGERMAQAQASGDEVVTANVDVALARTKRVASGNDILRERRPEWYRALVHKPQ